MIKIVNKSTITLFTFIAMFSVLFIVYREMRFYNSTEKALKFQAENIAISLWQFDEEVCHSNINFLSKLNDYKSLEVIDYTGTTFTKSSVEIPLTTIDKIFIKLNLIRTIHLSTDIQYNNKRIGSLNVERYNKEIYNYLYIVLVLLLLFLIFVAFSNIYQTNSNLEKIVNEKTKRLRQSEEKLQITLNSICDGVLATDNRGLIVNMNPIAESILGISLQKSKGKPASELVHIYDTDTQKQIIQTENSLVTSKIESIGSLTKNGEDKFLTVTRSPILDIQKNNVGTVYVLRDITEELKSEETARHSQKMESIGQLAGGIAHDFNNMLGGILGAAELLEIEFDEESDPDIVENIELIKESANLAADLTKQLLLFSRKNDAAMNDESVAEVINSTILMLKRSIDKKIEVTFSDLSQSDVFIHCDKAQLQNALLNLGVNARDALGDEGTITFTIQNQTVTEEKKLNDLKAGDYVHITVSDNGAGMSKELQKKIFEPFFTTKEKGKGTGLGLAAVYGTVREHQGTITVESIKGQGTDFHIYLPLLHTSSLSNNVKLIAPSTVKDSSEQAQTILLVEDEGLIRTIELKMLSKLGYTIVEAANGEDAVKIYEKKHKEIDIVLMDYIMPRLNGRDAFLKMKEINDKVRVIIMSGNINDSKIEDLKNIGVEDFIKKPFQWHDIKDILTT